MNFLGTDQILQLIGQKRKCTIECVGGDVEDLVLVPVPGLNSYDHGINIIVNRGEDVGAARQAYKSL